MSLQRAGSEVGQRGAVVQPSDEQEPSQHETVPGGQDVAFGDTASQASFVLAQEWSAQATGSDDGQTNDGGQNTADA